MFDVKTPSFLRSTLVLSLAGGCVNGCTRSSSPGPARSEAGATSASPDEETAQDGGAERGGGSVDADVVADNPCTPASALGSTPAIDDFEDGDTQLLVVEDRAGSWFFYDDGSGGEQTHQVVEEDGSHALHVASTGWTVWGSGFGATLAPSSSLSRACAYDSSVYGGLRFRAKGTGRVRLRLAMPETTPVAEGGQCSKPQDDCYDWPGLWFNLEPTWRVYSLPFCALQPEGWSSDPAELDPSRLSAVHFMLQAGPDVDMWLDDLQFTLDEAATAQDAGADQCAAPCPLQAAPPSSILAPAESYLALVDGLELHTFEQESVRCGPLMRRYLSFVPPTMAEASSAPVVIALHGSGANAESMQDLQARGRLDELALRDGAVVVYGNAAPGAHSSADPNNTNSGAWRQDYFDDGEVDDVEYLEMVLDDLQRRGVIEGDNAVYLTGISNGGGMVLRAARELPDRISGIAPFMAFDGFEPRPVPDLTGSTLSKVLFGYASEDPGVPLGYPAIQAQLPAQWASAVGVPAATIEAAVAKPLPDLVVEGEDYTGTSSIALSTRDSQPSRIDYVAPDAQAAVQVLVFERAGHFWPTPTGDTEAWILDRWGFRNQDLDASDALWEFFGLEEN